MQAVYQLSKRTDVYAETIYQCASSGAPAVINTNDPSSSRSQLLVGTGIRHRFQDRATSAAVGAAKPESAQ